MAAVYMEMGQPRMAAELFAGSLQRASERFGADSAEVATASLPVAAALEKAGELAEAEKLYRSAAATAERLAGPRAAVTARYLVLLGECLVRHRSWAEASRILSRAREIYDMVGNEAALTTVLDQLLTVYQATDEKDAALTAVDRFARGVARFQAEDRVAVAAAVERQVEIRKWLGREGDETERLARRAAILRGAAERAQIEDERAEAHRREAVLPVVSTVPDVLADTKPRTT